MKPEGMSGGRGRGGGGKQEVVIQLYILTIKTTRGLKTTSWRCYTTAFSSSSTEREKH